MKPNGLHLAYPDCALWPKYLGAYRAHGEDQQAINRAIRAELAGGPETLDALAKVHKLIVGRRWQGAPETPELNRWTNSTGRPTRLAEAYTAVKAIAEAMDLEIRRRYGLPLGSEQSTGQSR